MITTLCQQLAHHQAANQQAMNVHRDLRSQIGTLERSGQHRRAAEFSEWLPAMAADEAETAANLAHCQAFFASVMTQVSAANDSGDFSCA